MLPIRSQEHCLENPISKCGIREHYRSDASSADHHQSLAGGGDSASQSDPLNGTISGNTMKAIPEMPTTESNRPSKNGSKGLLFSRSGDSAGVIFSIRECTRSA